MRAVCTGRAGTPHVRTIVKAKPEPDWDETVFDCPHCEAEVRLNSEGELLERLEGIVDTIDLGHLERLAR